MDYVATRAPLVKTVSLDGPRINFSLPGFCTDRLSKPHAGAPAVLVDELDARRFQRATDRELIGGGK
jgi:hypothetical protein